VTETYVFILLILIELVQVCITQVLRFKLLPSYHMYQICE